MRERRGSTRRVLVRRGKSSTKTRLALTLAAIAAASQRGAVARAADGAGAPDQLVNYTSGGSPFLFTGSNGGDATLPAGNGGRGGGITLTQSSAAVSGLGARGGNGGAGTGAGFRGGAGGNA